MKKNTLIKLTSLLGAFLFALGMMIGNSSTVVANSDDPTSVSCKGSSIQCVSHLPGRLP